MKAAPLTSLLLARKGDARPALAPAKDAVAPLVAAAPRAEASSLATAMRPSHEGPALPVANGERPAPAFRVWTGFDGGGPGGSDAVRLSVRMDRDRHRKLRILAAQRGLSLQKALIRAIDDLVSTSVAQADGGNCACLRTGQPRLVGRDGGGPAKP